MSPRCADASVARGEELAATASTVSVFLLIEDPGPWGPHVLHSARLPEAVRARLRALSARVGVRTLLIRRPGRAEGDGGPRLVVVANARHGWAETTRVNDLAEVAALELDAARGPDGVGLTPHADPLLLVCTHGRHDPCCAERGRPLAAAVAASYPDLTWEASHLGGDRFAGNLVALPRGDYFGRLDPNTGPAAVASYLAGTLDLAHYRGRSDRGWVAQAAEQRARLAFGAAGLDDVTVTGVGREGSGHLVRLLVRGREVAAHVRVGRGASAHLTCHADHDDAPPVYDVVLEG